MEKAIKYIGILIIALSAIFAVNGSVNSSDAITIRGDIVPVNWENTTFHTEVLIYTSNQDKYFVVNNEKGKELLNLNLVGRAVKASGTLGSNDFGEKTILIESYTVLE